MTTGIESSMKIGIGHWSQKSGMKTAVTTMVIGQILEWEPGCIYCFNGTNSSLVARTNIVRDRNCDGFKDGSWDMNRNVII